MRGRTSEDRIDPQQPDEDASSDGDRSWRDDPITVDPDQDRSIDAALRRSQSGAASSEESDE